MSFSPKETVGRVPPKKSAARKKAVVRKKPPTVKGASDSTAKRKAKAKRNRAVGSSLDSLLAEEGILNQTQAGAAKRVISWQVKQLLELQNLSVSELAEKMNTSRAAVNRILDPENTSLTLNSLGAVADLFGKKLEIQLKDV